MAHLTNPFSLQSGHLTRGVPLLYCWGPSVTLRPLQVGLGWSPPKTLLLPLQVGHNTKRCPAQTLQGTLEGVRGIPCRRVRRAPFSCRRTTSSAPPMYLPLMKSLGGTTLPHMILQSSSLYSMCIETSLSEYTTLKLPSRNRIALQSSNVFLIPLRLVE